MKAKNFIRLFVCLATLTLVLAACSSGSGNTDNNAVQKQPETQAPATTDNASSTNQKAKTDYPTKTIRMIVPFAAGGGTDSVGRALAAGMSEVLGVSVVVENQTGGSGAVGMNAALHSDPDGYTISLGSREVTSLPLLGLAPFDTLDFKFVANVNTDPAVLVVSSESKYQTLDSLVEDMKANPGKLTFAASAVPNYYAIPFAEAAKVEYTTVPFQGAALAIVELLGQRATFGLYGPGEVLAQVEDGGLRALAIMSEERIDTFPDVPTMKELGIDATSGTYRGIIAPGGTPDEIVKVLDDAIAQTVKSQKFIDFMKKNSFGIDYRNSADFKAMIQEDIKKLEPMKKMAQK